MRRRVCLAVVAIASVVGVSPLGVAGATTSATPTSSCVVRITALGFHPRHVDSGGSSVVRLTAQNCTPRVQHATLTWLGRFVGATPGIPPGCPAIDPVAEAAHFAPHGEFRTRLGFVVFSSCTATALAETARLTGANGTVLAERTVDLLIS